MNLLQLISARLRELRLRHGLTQEEAAEVCELGHKFYQRVEAGNKKQIWLETVERLAAAFGLEVWELLAPKLPKRTRRLRHEPKSSNVHYKHQRRGPYAGRDAAEGATE
jgi:transcriptional regulator with XRE-family HTH domain